MSTQEVSWVRGVPKPWLNKKNRKKNHKEGTQLLFVYSTDVYYRSVSCNENGQDRLDSLLLRESFDWWLSRDDCLDPVFLGFSSALLNQLYEAWIFWILIYSNSLVCIS